MGGNVLNPTVFAKLLEPNDRNFRCQGETTPGDGGDFGGMGVIKDQLCGIQADLKSMLGIVIMKELLNVA